MAEQPVEDLLPADAVPLVPDTGQARVLSCTCDYAGMEGEPHKTWCELEGGPHAECAARVEALEAERDQLRAQLAGVPDTGQDREDIRGWLHEQIEAGRDPMLARVLAALNEPAGGTVQAPDVAALDDDHAVQVAAERLRAAAAALPRIDITDHDRTVLRWLASYMQGPPSSRSVAVARALLGEKENQPDVEPSGDTGQAREMPTGHAFLAEFHTPSLMGGKAARPTPAPALTDATASGTWHHPTTCGGCGASITWAAALGQWINASGVDPVICPPASGPHRPGSGR